MLLLRHRAEDVQELARAIADSREHLAEWLAWAASASQESLAEFVAGSNRAWDDRRSFNFLMREPSGELVGGAGLHPRLGPGAIEIGYWVRRDRINRGFATATAGALTQAALALPDIDRVEIHCDEANVRSAAVPRKLGYRLDRIEDDEASTPAEVGRSMIWVYERPSREGGCAKGG